MKTTDDDEFERIQKESGWRKRQIMAEDDDDIQDYKKFWVGLTNSEYQDILIKHENGGLLSFYNLVEEKLKQKNTE
jgi:hypothetical protein